MIEFFTGKSIDIKSDKIEIFVDEKPIKIDIKPIDDNLFYIFIDQSLKEEDLSKDIFLHINNDQKIRVYSIEVLDNLYYDGPLGSFFSPQHTEFYVWSPVSKWVELLLYPSIEEQPEKIVRMQRLKNGVWYTKVIGNLEGWFYRYRFFSYGKIRESVDLYSKAVSLQSTHGVVVDLEKTNPSKWKEDHHVSLKNYQDAIIYEIHVADMTGSTNSGVQKKSSYLGLTEDNTFTPQGVNTGLSHITELGVTHVHLLPINDFYTGDDIQRDFENHYNWGYDPYLYMVPEGSYSTNPSDPICRIKEVKQMIQRFHEKGIGVIIDVVFPHTFSKGEQSPFDQTVPFYYYRIDKTGGYIDETGMGNTVASERLMVRRFILDTLIYWTKEYHIDGFRFDQMGVMDKQTMFTIQKEIKSINPSAILYGEPWGGMGVKPRFGKDDVKGTKIAVFNDEFRDAIRGSVFNVKKKGFIMGAHGKEYQIRRGVVGSVEYNLKIKGFALNSEESINYAECHDNHTLWDKNMLAAISDKSKKWSVEELKNCQKLAAAIILTSQGVPFLHAGQDFCRTKNFNGNSYNAPISLNALNYDRKLEFIDVYEYHKGLIKLRKHHPAFRMRTTEQIKKHITFLSAPKRVVAFLIKDHANDDVWDQILVLYNANTERVHFELPDGNWSVVVDSKQAGIETLYQVEKEVILEPISASIMYVR
ncbi:type I pullulanase [Thermotoga profunda]|uniref:type I pullulanase n=1 Tax=Thermotoga profunda TaxID=1508420 RepID=UPI0006935125|nr:type I pullulanase [Thermotoga profunda]